MWRPWGWPSRLPSRPVRPGPGRRRADEGGRGAADDDRGGPARGAELAARRLVLRPAPPRLQGRRQPPPVTTKWMVFTLNLMQDELILHTCKLLALFLLRGNIWLQLPRYVILFSRNSRTGHNVISREKNCKYLCVLSAGSVAIYSQFFSSNRKWEVLKLGHLTICFQINISFLKLSGALKKQK